MCLANDELWGEITRSALNDGMPALPFVDESPQMLPVDKDDLPSSLRPASLDAPEPAKFRAPHRAIEVLVIATAAIVAVFTALTIPMANDADRSDEVRASESQPVSVSTHP